jgi:tripartite-type tricarboxylate transporter receptor subunit TctC
VSPWFGILAPARTPPTIVVRLNDEIVKALHDPKVRERLGRDGVDAVGDTPREFASFIRVEMEKWSKAVKESGAKVE